MQVNSTVKRNMPRIRQLTHAAVTALEWTGEQLHQDTQQAQVFPFDTGHLQEDATFVDCSRAKDGKVTLVSSTPYARRLYYHPEYHFQTKRRGCGMKTGCLAERMLAMRQRHSKSFIKRQVVCDAEINRYPRMDCISRHCRGPARLYR